MTYLVVKLLFLIIKELMQAKFQVHSKSRTSVQLGQSGDSGDGGACCLDEYKLLASYPSTLTSPTPTPHFQAGQK